MQNVARISLFHGEALFRAGQMATYFYLVESGLIQILDRDGHMVKRQFGGSELFGIPEVLARGHWDLTAVAEGPTTVRRFPAEALFATLADMPGEHGRFLHGIAAMA
ncbi:MAG: cyclic nucleotide-binding domain-containing protein [Rhodobiaceae bacterium]|jgi:CRP-like cAMP-binding protein